MKSISCKALSLFLLPLIIFNNLVFADCLPLYQSNVYQFSKQDIPLSLSEKAQIGFFTYVTFGLGGLYVINQYNKLEEERDQKFSQWRKATELLLQSQNGQGLLLEEILLATKEAQPSLDLQSLAQMISKANESGHLCLDLNKDPLTFNEIKDKVIAGTLLVGDAPRPLSSAPGQFFLHESICLGADLSSNSGYAATAIIYRSIDLNDAESAAEKSCAKNKGQLIKKSVKTLNAGQIACTAICKKNTIEISTESFELISATGERTDNVDELFVKLKELCADADNNLLSRATFSDNKIATAKNSCWQTDIRRQ